MTKKKGTQMQKKPAEVPAVPERFDEFVLQELVNARQEIARLQAELTGQTTRYALYRDQGGAVYNVMLGLGEFVSLEYHTEYSRIAMKLAKALGTVHAHFRAAEGKRRTKPEILSSYINLIGGIKDEFVSFMLHYHYKPGTIDAAKARLVEYETALHLAKKNDTSHIERLLDEDPLELDWLMRLVKKTPTRGRGGRTEPHLDWVGDQVRALEADGATYDEIVRELRIRTARLDDPEWRRKIREMLDKWNRHSTQRLTREWLRRCAERPATDSDEYDG